MGVYGRRVSNMGAERMALAGQPERYFRRAAASSDPINKLGEIGNVRTRFRFHPFIEYLKQMSWVSFLLTLFMVQAPASPQSRASLQGFVLKIGTGDPVSKAVVSLTRTDSQRRAYTTTTGVDGKFA